MINLASHVLAPKSTLAHRDGRELTVGDSMGALPASRFPSLFPHSHLGVFN